MKTNRSDFAWRGGWPGLLLACLFALPAPAAGEPEPPATGEAATTMPAEPSGEVATTMPAEPAGEATAAGDELLMFQDIPVIVSSSRQKTQANAISVPVTIITGEDIHYSGLTSIPEILQFASGVEVVRIDRNHYAVGVRGMHDVFSDHTLVLIDGRSAYSPVFGGAEWFRFPLMVEDIKRIEVVRGPAAAAWGANAFNGAINIITKEPEETLGLFTSTTWNEYRDNYNHIRYGFKEGKLTLRTSVGYKDEVDSGRTGADDFINTMPQLGQLVGVKDFSTNDFNRTWVIDNKATYKLARETELSAGAAYSDVQAGPFELLAVRSKDGMQAETTRMFTKIKREESDGSGGYLQWFGNIERTHRAGIVHSQSMENDVEGQVDMLTSATNKLSFGGNVRLLNIADRDAGPEDIEFKGAPFKEQMAGLFVIDRWQATERLALEGQFRGDWYSETQADWASRLSALYAMDADKQHILRLSGAKAFRTPMAAIRRMETHRVPVGPGLFLMNVTPGDDLHNEEIYSAEAGYNGTLAKGVEVKANTYFQRMQRLIDTGGRLAQPGGVHFANIDGAHAYGAETELKLKNEKGELSAFYNHNVIRPDAENTARAFLTSENNAGLTGRLFLPHGFVFNTNFRYTDQTEIGDVVWDVDVEKSFRLDFTISKKVFGEHGELMFGVSDVLNDVTPAHASTTTLFPHETPGRTFFARLQISW